MMKLRYESFDLDLVCLCSVHGKLNNKSVHPKPPQMLIFRNSNNGWSNVVDSITFC